MGSVFISKSPEHTGRVAELLGKEIVQFSGMFQGSLVIALEGELGAGKTTFSKAFGKSLHVASPMHSPTFVLMKRYKIHKAGFENIWHIDCYRIDAVRELRVIGFFELLKNPTNILVIEWADKIKKSLPKHQTLWIDFKHMSARERRISFHT